MLCAGVGLVLGEAKTALAARSISELAPVATIRVGKTADWVALTADAVWVGSTAPNAVHRIDPKTNKMVASIALPGEPCAGLATGFGSLWIPMCTQAPSLARVDLSTNQLTTVFAVGAAAAEAGITTSSDSVWLVIDKAGSLVRIDPASGIVRQTVHVPPGSYNPFFSDGQIWVTRADGAEVTSVDASSGAIVATTRTGPNPRFLTAGGGAIWTLNQGDGTLTRVDARTKRVMASIALGMPGHGGDIGFGRGVVWITLPQFPLAAVSSATDTLLCQWAGPGGDSLGVGNDAIWLTDYHGGTISRIPISDALAYCRRTRIP
jgi:virginiamycin B lyase